MFASSAAFVVASSLVVAAAEPQAAAATDGAPSYMQPIYTDPPPGYYDPPPGYYDPPPAYYESDTPGAPPVYKDPPPGYYDPPPGWYDPPPGYYMPPAALPAPLPIPNDPAIAADLAMHNWLARRDQLRRRQIGWGVVLGASVVTLGLLIALPGPDCRSCGITERPFLSMSALILGKISLVSSIVNGVALGRHNRKRPAPTLSFAPGALHLSF